ncbi:bifunctional glutamate--cysteine ligase GshA/glutathione synthetase GshB [uncultured Bacteroides sp.]|uniref:bifunctional glutamate--cysteine ligase GshA/glutathione synthetase GshB n=1 Tax=uncultured Bacteroides sp. TaxID=162156 RepID=UPI002AA7D99B|nr:bifunctional glutamate--cysteine ligase GshA/glutathione synthetase GshB [uncultured Bacteroides sp.]
MKEDIFQSANNLLKGNIWLDALFGIEKENIRVDIDGKLAQTPHPTVFGNKLKHPYITTDFSESQVEMITPPLPDIKQTIGFLETVHDIVSLELTDEYLWPQSIPPILPDDEQIPIAQYDEEGKAAQHYREFLAKKYGAKNQLISGIHFNLSYSEKLLEVLYHKINPSLSYEEFKDEVYLKTVRQMLRLRWLYVLLYGDSPVVDSSLELKCKLAPYTINNHVVALSIRNSCYGYRNISDLYPDYSSVTNFRSSVEQMVKDQQITSFKELYSPVRPKFMKSPEHISYIELRFIDIDPLTKAGITEEELSFLHALTLYGLLSKEPDCFNAEAQAKANRYYGCVALYGLDAVPCMFEQEGEQTNIWHKAKTLIQEVITLFEELGIDKSEYPDSLSHAMQLTKHPEKRKVHEVLNGVHTIGYIPYHLKKAKDYLLESQQKNYNFIGLEDMELSTQLLLREAVRRGISFDIMDRKENFIRLEKEGNIQYVKQATKTSLDNYASILAMENKLVTKRILKEHGIRVPKGEEYTHAETAKADFIRFQGLSVVIKPNQTNFGTGITILKENRNETTFQRAVDIAFEHDSTILIEEFVEGKEYRFFVMRDKVVGILHRVPANVAGNGIQSIRELVHLKNEDPLRGKGYRTPLEKIQLGEAEAIFLQAQHKTFDYIPMAGEIVYLRENSNISTGGDSIDFTDDIPDSYKQIAIQAAQALNVSITGLDMIIPDYRKEASKDNYAIIELNFNPAIHIHCHPFKGENRKLNEKLIDALGYKPV